MTQMILALQSNLCLHQTSVIYFLDCAFIRSFSKYTYKCLLCMFSSLCTSYHKRPEKNGRKGEIGGTETAYPQSSISYKLVLKIQALIKVNS